MASPETASTAKAILRWTLCSLRPLSVDELREALRLDIGESLNQLDKTAGEICGNLCVDSDLRVQATHQTVRDFFFGHSQDGFEHAMKQNTEHARITEICLLYLGGDDMKPRRFRHANSHAHKEVKRSPFSTYAIMYFSDHIAHSLSYSKELLAALNSFLMGNSTTWIEAIASTKDLTPITQTASNLKAYMERRARHESPLGVEVHNVLAWGKRSCLSCGAVRQGTHSKPPSDLSPHPCHLPKEVHHLSGLQHPPTRPSSGRTRAGRVG